MLAGGTQKESYPLLVLSQGTQAVFAFAFLQDTQQPNRRGHVNR